ncbi:MAG: cupin domain-containing protein [Angustibacter sp.]
MTPAEDLPGQDPRSVLPTSVLKDLPAGPVRELLLPHHGDDGSAPPFRMSSWAVDPGGWSEWDVHDVLEVWLVASGTGTVLRGADTPTPVRAGDAVFMPSQVRHRMHNDGRTRIELFSIWWPGHGPSEAVR